MLHSVFDNNNNLVLLLLLRVGLLLLLTHLVPATAAVPFLPRGAARTTALYGPGYLASRADDVDDTIPSNCAELCDCSDLVEDALFLCETNPNRERCDDLGLCVIATEYGPEEQEQEQEQPSVDTASVSTPPLVEEQEQQQQQEQEPGAQDEEWIPVL